MKSRPTPARVERLVRSKRSVTHTRESIQSRKAKRRTSIFCKLKGVLSAATKAGLDVARVEIDSQEKIVLFTNHGQDIVEVESSWEELTKQ